MRVAAHSGGERRQPTFFNQPDAGDTVKVQCGISRTPVAPKEQTMKLSSRSLAWVLTALCPLAACTANTTSPDGPAQTSDELKGGVPAAGQSKGKGKGGAGDAGVDETPGKGHGKGKDKTKKVHAPKSDAGPEGDEDSAGDEDSDEADEVDEAADVDEAV
jgi:hypothetical protein